MRSAPARRQPATAPRPTIPAPNTTHVEPGLDLGGSERRAEPGREAAGEQRGAVERRLGVDLRERDLRHHRVLGERRGAHEVAQRLAVARQARGAVGQVALVLLLADREAQVRARAAAVDALAALRREQRHDVVAGRDERHVLPDALHDAGALVAEHARRVAGRVGAARRCRGRCGRRRRRRAARAPRRVPARPAPPPARRAAGRTPPAPRHASACAHSSVSAIRAPHFGAQVRVTAADALPVTRVRLIAALACAALAPARARRDRHRQADPQSALARRRDGDRVLPRAGSVVRRQAR